MTSAGGFIISIYNFPIFQDADAGSAATYIHYSTIGDLKYGSSGSRLINDIGYLKAGALQDIADTLYTAFGNSRGNGSSGIGEFCIQLLLQLGF